MEDKNQSAATEPVQSAVQTPPNQGTGNIDMGSQTDEKEGLEQDGSIKNSK